MRTTISTSFAIAFGSLLLLSAETALADKNTALEWEERDRWEQYLPDADEYWESQWRWYDEAYRPYYDRRALGDHWELPSYLKRYSHDYRGYADYYQGPWSRRPAYVYPDTSPAPPGYGTGDWYAYPDLDTDSWR